MTQTTKSKITFDQGYKRTKTITYTLTEFVRPLKKKAVQMSFPFPEETKKDTEPKVTDFRNQEIIGNGYSVKIK